MNDFKSYLFLINPVSGSARKDWKRIFEKHKPDNHHFDYILWDKKERKKEIIREIERSEADVLVAVGGDGTINLLADIAFRNGKTLGIIPAGSGNGLARHLGIPLNPKRAIDHLLNSGIRKIDVASMNDKNFLCTAGVGFDALIGKAFASRESTGLLGYVKKVVVHAFSYKAETYSLNWSSEMIERQAYLITFANASQYGNNAFIAPTANIEDGKINVCIMKPFPLIMAIPIAFRLFTRSIESSKYLETLKVPEINIKRKSGPVHLDGDPFEMEEELKVRIRPEKLNVIG